MRLIILAVGLSILTLAGFADSGVPASATHPRKTAKRTPKVQQRKVPAPDSAKPLQPAAGESSKGAVKGMVVFIDPATGQIREPTTQEIENLTRQSVQPSEPGKTTETGKTASSPNGPTQGVTEALHGPGGAVGMTLGPEFQRDIIVTRGAGGSLRMEESVGSANEAPDPRSTSSSQHDKK